MFRCDEDREKYLDLWGAMIAARGWRALAYCLMRNHVHHLVEVPGVDLGEGIGDAHRKYAIWFNRKYDHVGRGFERRFGSSRAKDEATILYFAGYVVLNPVRASLVDRPEDHGWSSHAATLGMVPAPRWLDEARLLERFGGLDRYCRVIDALQIMGAAGFDSAL
jgi:REP element-mobilizing transposase RayT